MNIEAVKMQDITSDENDIYTTIMIISNRARQVIDKRFINQIDLDEIEDSEDLIDFSKEDFDKEKPMMKAFSEFLNNELECVNKSSDDSLNELDD
tara:strand:+ start:1840 stop:2124 length:285 start_codon:yes stop_codon:yes gene_type:complete